MSLAKKISDDVKSALKGGDKKKLSIARYVYSELKNFLIKENLDRDVLKLSDENIIKIVKTQLKQKKESLIPYLINGAILIHFRENGITLEHKCYLILE